MQTLDRSLRLIRDEPELKYGGASVLYCGDFSQLVPIKAKTRAIYDNPPFEQWYDWTNAFIERTGRHRFIGPYGMIMDSLCHGILTNEDYDTLDTRVVGAPNGPSVTDIPNDTQIACFDNQDRVAMNNAVFAHHLHATHSKTLDTPPPKHTLMIKGSDITWAHSNGQPVYRACHDLWNKCGDNDVHPKGFTHNFFDPLLKLYIGVPLMLTANLDVANGKANGTVGTLSKMVLTCDSSDALHTIIVDGYHVNCIEARFVSHLLLDTSTHDVIKLHPEYRNCQVTMSIKLVEDAPKQRIKNTGMKFLQAPILINHCTTVHKLQGKTVANLLITSWHYAAR